MKTTIPNLRRIIQEAIRVYDGSPDTPNSSTVQVWALDLGFSKGSSRAYPYPSYYTLKHPDNEDISFQLSVHLNNSLGRTFITATVHDNSAGHSGVRTYKKENVHSMDELLELYDEFITPIHSHQV
jgi:hypothetical protein